MIESLFDWVDLILRALGWLLAAAIGLSVLGSSLVILVSIFNTFFMGPGIFNKILALVLPGPIVALYLLCVWRVLRFAGGFTGSSEYPLHHVVRLLF